MVTNHRSPDGRKDNTSFIILDTQSVKNTETAEQKGYDAGKKISGIKRHIAVDNQGLSHAIFITTANISDKAGAKKMVEEAPESPSEVTKILVDGGYNGAPFAECIFETLRASVEVAKRSFAWIERCRRLWKNCESKFSTSLAMVQLAFLSLLL